MGLEIKKYGHPLLWRKSEQIEKIDGSIKHLVKQMVETMYQNKGVGLSAPQIGVLKRIIVVDSGEGLIVLINPKILSCSGKQVGPEGCLSVPGVYLEIKRASEVIVEGLDKEGVYTQLEAKDMSARAIQHEIDHLDGILITERVSKKKLKPVKAELDKIKSISI
jgi:peptide deformylase